MLYGGVTSNNPTSPYYIPTQGWDQFKSELELNWN